MWRTARFAEATACSGLARSATWTPSWTPATSCCPSTSAWPRRGSASTACSLRRPNTSTNAIALRGIDSPQYQATDTDQNTHRNLNFIRAFSGRGTLIWGARTLSDTDRWRYIPVRRLFSTVERDIQDALRIAVFDPNTQSTWQMVRSAVDHYLYNLWKHGGLQGQKPDEAYSVQVGEGVTMTADDVAAGRLILKVGLAAVRPAEFSILQFTVQVGQTD